MQLIDTHTHLYAEVFEEDQQLVVEQAIAAGVAHFFIPAIDSAYIERMYALEAAYPKSIHLMAGLHPTHVKENAAEELAKVAEQLKVRNFCAIGEIGIDLYWDKQFIKEQQAAFNQQIKWAKQYALPIVIHCREAFDEVFEILEAHKAEDLYGIFHCFTGTLKQAKQVINLNFKLGIGAVVTFKNGKVDQFLHEIPIEAIVLETDAPYLAPAPYRGKRNESKYLTLIAEKVAQCYGITVKDVANKTSNNAIEVFKNQKIDFKK
jgi:TatD DNase family protein